MLIAMMSVCRKTIWGLVFLWLCVATVYAADGGLTVYPAPAGVALNSDFTVKVRQPGANWQTVDCYLIHVNNNTLRRVEAASMGYFDMDGPVEVEVTYNKGAVKKARVRPLACNIATHISGHTLSFTLGGPCNISVEVNGDLYHNLHLFANPMQGPAPQGADEISFGPGVHTLEGGRLMVPSGKTVFVAGGAVLKGQLVVSKASHVRIIGHGMIDLMVKAGVKIANSKNVLVDGVICSQCPTGGSDSVTVRNVKAISYYSWGDGMNVFASSNVLFDGVFCRTADDCTTVYGTRNGYVGGCRNITMQNATLWCDVGHPILVGTHGNAPHPDVLENLTYRNIDILEQNEPQINYQGCMALNAGDNNLIRNVRFENIRVEDFTRGQLLNLRVFFNRKYCAAPGKGIENVYFKNITYTGHHAELSIIDGYDDSRKIRNLVFDNLKINNTLICDSMPTKPGWYQTADMARFAIGEHVEGLRFIK